MATQATRIPEHVGIIPDGNRRWAVARGLPKKDGYEYGIEPAMRLFNDVWEQGIKEMSVYIFTKENVHRPKDQVQSFKNAFLKYLDWAKQMDASLLVVGDPEGRVFPAEATDYMTPRADRQRKKRLNFLVNYNWEWDLLQGLKADGGKKRAGGVTARIGSRDIPKVDLVIRWGGRNRLSGFLPVQTAYADIYVADALWPDYGVGHLRDAIQWYGRQDITMGG